ncbi:hypothetical protein ACIBCH_20785 [Amycolatopsis thailandensis]|uniref:hypothetical protein n=1 Tax=Amycolatopsis thailandensis TaxID=589330 RepID=UPI0037B45BEF
MTRRRCTRPGCLRPHQARGLCNPHYAQANRRGEFATTPRTERGLCTVDGCTRRHDARGYCGRHYVRWRRYGNPTGGRSPLPPRELADLRRLVGIAA